MKLITAALLAVALTGCATIEPSPPLSVVSIHEAPGKTKQEICSAARDWAALNFKDSKAVIEVFDAERGKLIGKGNMIVYGYMSTPYTVAFTMEVECKDGRARSSFNDYTMRIQGQIYPLSEDSANHLQTKARAKTNEMARSLEGQMVGVTKAENW